MGLGATQTLMGLGWKGLGRGLRFQTLTPPMMNLISTCGLQDCGFSTGCSSCVTVAHEHNISGLLVLVTVTYMPPVGIPLRHSSEPRFLPPQSSAQPRVGAPTSPISGFCLALVGIPLSLTSGFRFFHLFCLSHSVPLRSHLLH